MVEAERQGIPFWPAASILDTPSIISFWRSVKVEAETTARTELERIKRKQAALAAQPHSPIQRLD